MNVYVPGHQDKPLTKGRAFLLRAGSDLVISMHYTANGKPSIDHSRIGLIFAAEPPTEEAWTVVANKTGFTVPARAEGYRVTGSYTAREDLKVWGIIPHMHFRGKSMEVTLVDGENRTPVLTVPHYSYSWQLRYEPTEELVLKKGMRLEYTAVFDNSANNSRNPNPDVDVLNGEQSWQEMAMTLLFVSRPAARAGTSYGR